MSRITQVANLAAGDVLPESWVDAVMTISNYLLGASGADIASATTLAIDSYFHRVTGSTTIDNISDSLGAVKGQRVKLQFLATCSVRHNGGGTGNVRLVAGLHATFVAGESLELVYDGTNWCESHRSPVHLSGETIEHSVFAGGTSTGYVLNDGSAISRTAYAGTFANMGTQYGSGDGSTTFNLPDDRGRMTVGWAQAGGHADVSTIGANEGIVAANRRPKHRTTNSLGASSSGGFSTGTYSGGQTYGSANIMSDADAQNQGGAHGYGTVSVSTSITGSIGTNNGNDPLDTPAYIVKPKLTRL